MIYSCQLRDRRHAQEGNANVMDEMYCAWIDKHKRDVGSPLHLDEQLNYDLRINQL